MLNNFKVKVDGLTIRVSMVDDFHADIDVRGPMINKKYLGVRLERDEEADQCRGIGNYILNNRRRR